MTGFELRVFQSLSEIPESAWDALLDADATPFVRWAWLEALEISGCATPETGWIPHHLTLWRDDALVAAAPAYVRTDSDGDFSRDFGWAESAARAGVAYYPKLVIGVPFTPATGRRILVAPGVDRAVATAALVEGARDLARREALGSLHVLFATAAEAQSLESLGWATRVDFQYHWRNEGYTSAEQFWSRFSSKKRNTLNRERAASAKQGIAIATIRGEAIRSQASEWARNVHALHRATVDKMYWGRRWLNEAFYQRIFARMPENLEVVEARREGRLIAGAFNVASSSRLYGRYWGCFEEHPFLHFNVCLYHSIEDCIARGLSAFEGGAGGEHKLSRGFEPALTHSAHLILDSRLDAAVRRHLQRESVERQEALTRWQQSAPVLKRP